MEYGPVVTAVTAAASRAVLCYANGFFVPAALVYNAVDMAVSMVANHVLKVNAASVEDSLNSVFASRILGCVIGLGVTALLFGPMSVMLAVALNLTSFAVSRLVSGIGQTVCTYTPNEEDCDLGDESRYTFVL